MFYQITCQYYWIKITSTANKNSVRNKFKGLLVATDAICFCMMLFFKAGNQWAEKLIYQKIFMAMIIHCTKIPHF